MLSAASANTTTDPPWKAEIMQRKHEKKKNDSIPKWKIELIKRLKEKAQAAELKMTAEARNSEDKLVLDEPILKVSENIFMRKELERKMSANQLLKKFDVSGHRFTRKENVVIIENNDPVDSATRQSGDELPTEGIVRRLKGRFGDGKATDAKPLSYRSKSSDDILKINYAEERKPASTNYSSRSASHYKQFKKFPSVDSDVYRPLKSSHSIENIILSSTHVTPSSLTELDHEDQVDLNSLHASVNVEQPSEIKKLSEFSDASRERPKFSDRTQQFTKSTVTLHASGFDTENKSANKEELVFIPETLTLTSPTLPNLNFSERAKLSESDKKSGENITSIDDVVIDEVSPKTVKPSKLLSNNKENIPDVPKRRNASITTTRSSPTKKDAKSNQRDNPYIIELGKVSMDPSQLKTKAAIAANEIMKESRTIRIVPRGKSQNSTASDSLSASKNAYGQTKEHLSTPKTPATHSVAKQTAKTSIKSKNTELDKKLPTSSVDDVIVKPKAEKSTSVINSTLKSTPKDETKKSVNKPIDESSSFATKPTVGRNFTISSSSEKVVTPRSDERNVTVNNMFGSKITSTRPTSKSAFSGGTFVIDPSRFKKSSAPAPVSQSTSSSKTTSNSSSTRVIVPKSQSEAAPHSTPPTEEDGGAAKGKRKLTVDQIIVVGGYVKLDHSSLSKPNKIRKGIRVKFEDDRLESVYQYPSESSLLKEEHENQLNQRMTSLNSEPGTKKDTQLGKYTPKYLLAMAQHHSDQINDDDDEDDQSSSKSSPSRKVVVSDVATPLPHEDAVTFSSSTSSGDLLF